MMSKCVTFDPHLPMRIPRVLNADWTMNLMDAKCTIQCDAIKYNNKNKNKKVQATREERIREERSPRV